MGLPWRSSSDEAYRALGGNLAAPFMALSFLALAVIPSLKITDKGLVDVDAFELVSLWDD
jgi:adenine deaminase